MFKVSLFILVLDTFYVYLDEVIYLCQIRNDPALKKGAAKAVYELYDIVTHDLVSSDLRYDFIKCNSPVFFYNFFNFLHSFFLFPRENLDTWNILARAREEGRLFSNIQWPNDPEIVSAFYFHTCHPFFSV